VKLPSAFVSVVTATLVPGEGADRRSGNGRTGSVFHDSRDQATITLRVADSRDEHCQE